jgi:hypothetical protein
MNFDQEQELIICLLLIMDKDRRISMRFLFWQVFHDSMLSSHFVNQLSCLKRYRTIKQCPNNVDAHLHKFPHLPYRLPQQCANLVLLFCRANSITLDPHKSGFCPYPAGGLLYRNGNIRKFLAQKAAYVYHATKVFTGSVISPCSKFQIFTSAMTVMYL